MRTKKFPNLNSPYLMLRSQKRRPASQKFFIKIKRRLKVNLELKWFWPTNRPSRPQESKARFRLIDLLSFLKNQNRVLSRQVSKFKKKSLMKSNLSSQKVVFLILKFKNCLNSQRIVLSQITNCMAKKKRLRKRSLQKVVFKIISCKKQSKISQRALSGTITSYQWWI